MSGASVKILAARVRAAYPKLDFGPYRPHMRAALLRQLMQADEAFRELEAGDRHRRNQILVEVGQALLKEETLP